MTAQKNFPRLGWQPIATAPNDEVVQLGWWADYGSAPTWRSEFGIAWKTRSAFFGLLKWSEREDWRSYATHWRPAPPPPND